MPPAGLKGPGEGGAAWEVAVVVVGGRWGESQLRRRFVRGLASNCWAPACNRFRRRRLVGVPALARMTHDADVLLGAMTFIYICPY